MLNGTKHSSESKANLSEKMKQVWKNDPDRRKRESLRQSALMKKFWAKEHQSAT